MVRFALLVGLALAAAPALAQTQTPETRAEDSLTVLRLSESAQRSLRRDELRAELRAEAAGADPRQVQADINRRMTTALERAKAVKSVDVETGGYSVYQERPQNSGARWHGQQSLVLTGEDFPELLALAGELQQQGLVFSSLMFQLKPQTARKVEDELTSEALKRLRARAERIAADMGMKVVRFRTIQAGNVLGDRPPPRPMMMRMEAAASVPAPVAEPGDQDVQVTVDAEVLLGPGQHP